MMLGRHPECPLRAAPLPSYGRLCSATNLNESSPSASGFARAMSIPAASKASTARVRQVSRKRRSVRRVNGGPAVSTDDVCLGSVYGENIVVLSVRRVCTGGTEYRGRDGVLGLRIQRAWAAILHWKPQVVRIFSERPLGIAD